MKSIVESTAAFEQWLAARTAPVRDDLKVKHRKMATDPFQFLRATFYRWAEVWPVVCAEWEKSLRLLGVGDLHIQNFGTWRDAEGRLVWGVNDFDEADRCCFAVDLVRTAVSAKLAADQADLLSISLAEAAALLLAGYQEGVAAGGKPLVLAYRHGGLLRMARSALRQPKAFWDRWLGQKTEPVSTKNEVPLGAREALLSSWPESADIEFRRNRTGRDPKGLGSLGRMRFFAYAEWRGGPIAREAKACTPSAWSWSRKKASRGNAIMTLMQRAVRSPDPLISMHGDWLVRPIAAECGRIDLDEVEKTGTEAQRIDDQQKLLKAMGFEIANVHLGSASRKELTTVLKHFSLEAFTQAGHGMLEAVEQDYVAWKRYWQWDDS